MPHGGDMFSGVNAAELQYVEGTPAGQAALNPGAAAASKASTTKAAASPSFTVAPPGRGSTIMTSGLGDAGRAFVNKKQLLGQGGADTTTPTKQLLGT